MLWTFYSFQTIKKIKGHSLFFLNGLSFSRFNFEKEYLFLALMAVKILFLTLSGFKTLKGLEKDCSEQQEQWFLRCLIVMLHKTKKAPVVQLMLSWNIWKILFFLSFCRSFCCFCCFLSCFHSRTRNSYLSNNSVVWV
mgnify:FL=1